jgi:hypothetical protein
MGDIVAIELWGRGWGNRGILHAGTEVVRFHRGDLWITCRLQYRGWRLPQWTPGHVTVLFFHDEAVALAAGHRPCALCRRDAYDADRRAWVASLGGPLPLARQMDRRLHGERIVGGTHPRRLDPARWSDLADGAFVLADGGPAVVFRDAVVPWTVQGYAGGPWRPAHGRVELIMPPSTVAALAAGYRPQIDRTALRGWTA